jgi:FkbH-like protein
MRGILRYPFDAALLMRKKKAIRAALRQEEGEREPRRIAILCGSTADAVKDALELFLLDAGIDPVFYLSEYNRHYEESVFENKLLAEFRPDFVYLHVTGENLLHWPDARDDAAGEKACDEFRRFRQMWEGLREKCPAAVIIQNNFALPYVQYLGNIDGVDARGFGRHIEALNRAIADFAAANSYVKVNDVHALSARIGLDRWHDRSLWHLYKLAVSYEAIPELSYNIARIIKASLGKSKKCLVLDLDNTLWGGVIGDDGAEGISIGRETPLAAAYTEFQEYVRLLKNRGVILAVCSKNEPKAAKEGLEHPDSVLGFEDFACFKANWREKHLNIVEIAEELNIGLDSLVFIDDNPVERESVRINLPEVETPEVDGQDVSSYIKIIDRAGYFDLTGLSAEDIARGDSYKANSQRELAQRTFASYDEFLASLSMVAEIKEFQPSYIERIAQLANKTNQFNLTAQRYTIAEIEKISADPAYLTLYGRLADRFGDNGLVSVIVGKKSEKALFVELWLMSCRVFKRGMEYAMFEALSDAARAAGLEKIIGQYRATAKNSLVAGFYEELGFLPLKEEGHYEYDLKNAITKRHFIAVNGLARGNFAP